MPKNSDDFYAKPGDVTAFIERWRASGAGERSNAQSFLNELCDLIGVPHPDPACEDDAANEYIFEKSISMPTPEGKATTGYIDLYKRGSFILENKQGSDPDEDAKPLSERMRRRRLRRKTGTAKRDTPAWFEAMKAARNQAAAYARALPPAERPPFILVIDVGYFIEVFSDFTGGGEYVAYPDQNNYRIRIEGLTDHAAIDRLRAVWLDPASLDESKKRARVSRDIADKLARLARTFEAQGRDPGTVADFLMRLIFTMFAEDVGLLPNECFTELLIRLRRTPEHFAFQMQDLWDKMQHGGFSSALNVKVRHFNGGLFENVEALPLSQDQLELLIEASEADWRDVEPAIFGTLLERALDPRERHKLGAHFTPRAYVERLVMPTVIEPLRAEWQVAADTARYLHEEGEEKKALHTLRAFHDHLCGVRVLDPACGSGNFLYVTLEHMKRLEGEVLEMLDSYGGGEQQLRTVDPHQFLGLEINPRARAIADLVLWIGYFQWHFRSRGNPRFQEPIISKFENIVERDAVLAYDERVPRLDADGAPVTRWDGQTMKLHPVTGEPVPDESAHEPLYDYANPRPAAWPAADYVVGNPPFVGIVRMRESLGDGYTESIRKAYPGLPASVDYVMYWWHKAALLLRESKIKRFGFITTNSVTQTLSRRVIQMHMDAKPPLSIAFAIPDHPWVESSDGADVRIAMTCATLGNNSGELHFTEKNSKNADIISSKYNVDIYSNLNTIDTNDLSNIISNDKLASMGVKLHGSGFILEDDDIKILIKNELNIKYIKKYMNGRDLIQSNRSLHVIDLFDANVKDIQKENPEIYQLIHERVKPERDVSRDQRNRENWWLYGRPRNEFRKALFDINRYIATTRTAKHRIFVFLESKIIPESKIVAIALDDAYYLGVLSSRIHVQWSLRTGAFLEDRPNYNHSDCFGKFPFPDATEEQKSKIREIGERLDAFRKERQAQHPDLTLTGMYNVLEKLRGGEALTKKEKEIHEQGLVTVLREIHDALDAAVAEAYGWPADLAEEEVLRRLVALNAERAGEERNGLVRWLRPEYQAPGEAPVQTQTELAGMPEEAAPTAGEKQEWPETLKERIAAVRGLLRTAGQPLSAREVARNFMRARVDKVEDILDFLAFDRSIRRTDDGRYAA